MKFALTILCRTNDCGALPNQKRNVSLPCCLGDGTRGLTMVELLAALAIIAILTVIAWQVFQANLNRFEAVPCMGNLRNLHGALSARLIDRGSWPQVPEEIPFNSYGEHDFWMAELAEYGMTERSWICPTLRRTARVTGVDPVEGSKIHYLPTLFDESPGTPRRWPNMPWALEIGNNHGRGLLVLFFDGSIQPSSEVRKQAESIPLPTEIQ